jgi:HTH-type transcriptional regulator, transcriptional repressor of NAD biosynthesis genes
MNAAARPHSRFRLGLIVGKFSPLHLGHEWLIEQAALQCDRLLILSYANPDYRRCGAEARRQWLANRFPDRETLVIDDAWLEHECARRALGMHALPANDAGDEIQQQFLAWLLRDVLRKAPDAMFCSEAYGPACAQVLTAVLQQEVTAVVVDQGRRHVPVSATQIRRDPRREQVWLNRDVAAAFVIRVALLGGESSGKTTLASALARHFKTGWVAEYGRELWEQQCGVLSEADLAKIGHEQIRREEEALRSADQYLFCDTSPLTTSGYSQWMFGHVGADLALLATRAYDAVVLCRPDFPFVQDGTRREKSFRARQHAWYRRQIAALKSPSMEAAGSVSERVSSVARWLSQLDFR